MPISSRLLTVACFARVVSLGAGLLAVAGCGPPEAGSVEVPEHLQRSGPMTIGPAISKGTSPSLGPGDFRPAPKPQAGRRRGG
jgi:hypothetical protein